jgi:hypothetical protein
MTDDPDVERRLQAAVAARSATVSPADDPATLTTIAAAVATRRRRQRATAVAVLAAATIVAVAAVALPRDHGDKVVVAATTTTTSTATTSTVTAPPTSTVAPTVPSEPATTAPPTTTPPALVANAIFPAGAGGFRYDSPEFVAKAFATDYLGMTSAEIEGSRPTDNADVRTVRVRAYPDAPTRMTVTVEHAPADDWVVIGAQSDDIVVDSAVDQGGQAVVSGTSRAFEAQIRIETREQGTTSAFATTTALGGSTDVLEPFTASLPSPATGAPFVLVLLVPDARGEGAAASATVLLVSAG